jgi:hypothetical protein
MHESAPLHASRPLHHSEVSRIVPHHGASPVRGDHVDNQTHQAEAARSSGCLSPSARELQPLREQLHAAQTDKLAFEQATDTRSFVDGAACSDASVAFCKAVDSSDDGAPHALAIKTTSPTNMRSSRSRTRLARSPWRYSFSKGSKTPSSRTAQDAQGSASRSESRPRRSASGSFSRRVSQCSRSFSGNMEASTESQANAARCVNSTDSRRFSRARNGPKALPSRSGMRRFKTL